MRWTAPILVLAGCVMQAKEMPTVDGRKPGEKVLTLTAADLYSGHEATRVLLKGSELVLDTRYWRADAAGVVVTDVIDLAGDGVLGSAASVGDLTVRLDADPGVTAQVRTGATFFPAAGAWTDWRPAEGVSQPKGL